MIATFMRGRPVADHRAVFRQFARRLAKAVRSKTAKHRSTKRASQRRRRHAS